MDTVNVLLNCSKKLVNKEHHSLSYITGLDATFLRCTSSCFVCFLFIKVFDLIWILLSNSIMGTKIVNNVK